MRLKLNFTALVLITILIAFASTAVSDTFKGKNILTGQWRGQEIEYVEGEILVELKNSTSISDIQNIDSNLNLVKPPNKLGWAKFIVHDNDTYGGIEILRQSLLFKNVELNKIEKACLIPNDPFFTTTHLQWALDHNWSSQPSGANGADINILRAWDIETGENDVLIVILDSGIPLDDQNILDHPELDDANKVILGRDFIENDDFPNDENGHGTHVAGIASAETDNATGIAGVAWGTRLYIVRVFDEDLNGSSEDLQDGIINAVDYANSNNQALVINYSGGGPAAPEVEEAVQYAFNNGEIPIVASTGNNSGLQPIKYPAAYSISHTNVIAVGATDPDDQRSGYSNFGPEITVAAPGGFGDPYDDNDIWSTFPGYPVTLNNDPWFCTANYSYAAGTSMATPMVTGFCALLLSVDNDLTAEQIRDIVELTADEVGGYNYQPNGWCEQLGHGRINVHHGLLNITPPEVVNTFPSINTSNPDAVIDIYFEDIQEMNLSDFIYEQGNVSIVGSQTSSHMYYASGNEELNIIHLDAVEPFALGETVTVTLGTGIRNKGMANLQSPYEFDFVVLDITIYVNASLNASSYQPNSTAQLTVSVEDINGDPISGATVEYTVKDVNNIVVLSGTCYELMGQYYDSFTTPSTPGPYTVHVTATKEGYIPGEGFTSFEVESLPGHELLVTVLEVSNYSISSGGSVDFTCRIQNIGNCPEDVTAKIHATGPGGYEEEQSVTPLGILQPEDWVVIDLTWTHNSSYPEDDYYTIDIIAYSNNSGATDIYTTMIYVGEIPPGQTYYFETHKFFCWSTSSSGPPFFQPPAYNSYNIQINGGNGQVSYDVIVNLIEYTDLSMDYSWYFPPNNYDGLTIFEVYHGPGSWNNAENCEYQAGTPSTNCSLDFENQYLAGQTGYIDVNVPDHDYDDLIFYVVNEDYQLEENNHPDWLSYNGPTISGDFEVSFSPPNTGTYRFGIFIDWDETISWNTGTYGEFDPGYLLIGWIEVTQNYYDVALTNVSCPSSVAPGDTAVAISNTIENLGIPLSNIILQTIITQNSGDQIVATFDSVCSAGNIVFYWNTIGMVLDTFNISSSIQHPQDMNPSNNSAECSVTIEWPEDPSAPTNLVTSVISYSVIAYYVELNWADNPEPDIDHYVVYRSDTSGFNPTPADSIGGPTSSDFTDQNVEPDTYYYYKVKARDIDGNLSEPSDQAGAYIPPMPAPEAPTNLTADTVNSTTIQLTWQDNSNNELGFVIRRSIDNNSNYENHDTVGTNITYYEDQNLAPMTTYYYKVYAYNLGGNSEYSNEASATTGPGIPPNAPTNLTADTLDATTIQLAWTDNSTDELGFKIERSLGNNTNYALIDSVETNETEYTDYNLLPDTTYYYQIYAFSEGGNSGYSNEAFATTGSLPPVPTDLVGPLPPLLPLSGSPYRVIGEISVPSDSTTIIEPGVVLMFNGHFKLDVFGVLLAIGTEDSMITFTRYDSFIWWWGIRFEDADSASVLKYCIIEYGHAEGSGTEDDGGGILCYNSAPSIRHCIIRNNKAAFCGGGFASLLKFPQDFSYNCIFGNEALYGGGIYLANCQAPQVRILNATVSNNTAYPNGNGGGVYSQDTFCHLKNSILWGNTYNQYYHNASGTDTASYCDIQNGWPGQGWGNINEDPLFVDPSTGDYHLQAASPCIDAGDPDSIYNDPNGTRNDMGAFYYSAVPSAPSELTADTIGTTTIQLTWTDNSNNELGFVIVDSIVGNNYTILDTVLADTTYYVHDSLEYSTTYYYRIYAYNQIGDSEYSNEASATTGSGAPEAPSNLEAVALNAFTVQLTWVDNSNDEIGFRIDRREESGNYAIIDSVNQDSISYIDYPLSPETIYYYIVYAYNSHGNSGPSNESVVETPPAPPDQLCGDLPDTLYQNISPYTVMCDILVPLDSSTFIEPGVVLRFDGHYKLNVFGTLTAIGNEEDSIIFTRKDVEDRWWGIRFDNADNSSILSYCVIEYGEALGDSAWIDRLGGGIMINYCSPTITHCLIQNNSAEGDDFWGGYGGGIGSHHSSAIITDNIICNNTTHYIGGGAYFNHSPVTFERNSVHHNITTRSNGYGGGLGLNADLTDIEILNCTIADNTCEGSSSNGGGVYIATNSHAEFHNSIFWDNSANQYPLVLIEQAGGLDTVLYCDLQDSSLNTLPEFGEGNFFNNPQFEDALSGNYHLTVNSPCIDAGNPILLDPDSTRSDVGAFYLDINNIPILFLSSCSLDFVAYVGGTNPENQAFYVDNVGIDTFDYNIINDLPDWLSVSPMNGGPIPPVDTITVSVDILGLLVGSYEHNIVVIAVGALGSPDTVNIRLNIEQPQGQMVILSPENPPIQIPANGGTFDFNIEVANYDTAAATFDIWTMATLPNGSEYGPIISVPHFTAPPNWSGNRNRTQAVPAGAPSGNYTYDAYIGDYPDSVLAEDHFDFEKLTDSDGGPIIANWDNWGEEFEELLGETLVLIPEEFAFHHAYPNPFNPITKFQFDLPEPSNVRLIIFNIQGQQVAKLVDNWYSAGVYHATFDASLLSSGIYFARLEAGEFRKTQKLLLIK